MPARSKRPKASSRWTRPSAVESGQERPQRMLPVQLVSAGREHEQQFGLQVSDEEGKQVQGRSELPSAGPP